jgi:hypothetical protein
VNLSLLAPIMLTHVRVHLGRRDPVHRGHDAQCLPCDRSCNPATLDLLLLHACDQLRQVRTMRALCSLAVLQFVPWYRTENGVAA